LFYLSRQRHRCHNPKFFGTARHLLYIEIFWKKVCCSLALRLVEMDPDPDPDAAPNSDRQALDVDPDPPKIS
jgi:hypothetical protein